MKTSEFKTMYDELCGSHPKNFHTEGQEAIWSRKFGNKNAKVFRALVDQLSTREAFPSISLALHIYQRLAGDKGQKDYRENRNFLPDKVKNMTQEEIDADYKLLSSFMEAYPFPDYPEGANQETCEKIDREYYDRMRKAGIDPNEITHPKMFKGLMADLFGGLPDINRVSKRGGGWKQSFKDYNLGREQKDFQEVKILLRETAV